MPPVAAVFTAFFLVAVPSIVFMGIWAFVTACRIVFPERDLPFDRAHWHKAAREREARAVRVGLRDILEDERRRPSRPVMPHEARRRMRVVEGDGGPAQNPLTEDLWRRRN